LTISNHIKRGEKIGIVGKIGSGKSSLLLSLLNEVPNTLGKLSFKGDLAYVEQEPIIFPGTVRENILFGAPFNEDLYDSVLNSCCLRDDLKIFPVYD